MKITITPKINDIRADLVNPAIINENVDIIATVIPYGSWVLTWSTWTHPAPADDIIVVSDIGEIWSPQTAPERQAEIPIKNIGSVGLNIEATIGIKIPNVPQLVPVAKASNIATTKITAGKNVFNPLAAFAIRFPTNFVDPNKSLEIFLRLVAIVKIKIAGTIDWNPSGIASIDFSKEITPRPTK